MRRSRSRRSARCSVAFAFGLVALACSRTAETPPAPAGEPATTTAALAPVAGACAPGTQCVAVDAEGNPNPAGPSLAQCSGTFPDYIVPASLFPAGYQGPWFFAASAFPAQAPAAGPLPWEGIDFTQGVAQANAYLYALRDYGFEGNVEVDFRVQENQVRPWFTVPYMNYGQGRRELVHGVTKERTVTGPELGLKPGEAIANYAIGFYNDRGGYTIGRLWEDPRLPDLNALPFLDGTMVFKILFSTARPEQFSNPADYSLTGAPEWQIATGKGQLTTIRLMQMDVAARDPRAQPSGWVFGTFAFDKTATDPVAWNRLRPVGLQWGNAPGYTPADQQAGKPLPENTVSDQIPPYAAAHLGWAGRVNGPVDNPLSACMSCHGTGQYPLAAPMLPPSQCTDDQRLLWFRNVPATQPFGTTVGCAAGPPLPSLTPLDFSLQVQVAVQNILQYRDVNPCLPPAPSALLAEAPLPEGVMRVPRVSRDGSFVEEE